MNIDKLEDKYLKEEQLDEGVIDAIMLGMGIGAGYMAFEFLMALLIVMGVGGVITISKLQDKIKNVIRKRKNDKGAKEAKSWLQKSDTFRMLLLKVKAIKDIGSIGGKGFLKSLDKERMSIKRTLHSELNNDRRISVEARQYIYDMVPGLASTKAVAK